MLRVNRACSDHVCSRQGPDWMRAQEHDRVPNIIVQGLPSTGKTTVLRKLLPWLNLRHAYASCVECPNVHLLYQVLLSQLSPVVHDDQVSKACDRFADFAVELRRCASRKRTTYIVSGRARCLSCLGWCFTGVDGCVVQVVDDAELLVRYGGELVECFMKLPSLVRRLDGHHMHRMRQKAHPRLRRVCADRPQCVRRAGGQVGLEHHQSVH